MRSSCVRSLLSLLLLLLALCDCGSLAVTPAHAATPLTVQCAPGSTTCLQASLDARDDVVRGNDSGQDDSSSSSSDEAQRAPVLLGLSAAFIHDTMMTQKATVEAMENNYTVPRQTMSYGVIEPMPLRDVRIAALHVRPAASSRLTWRIVNMSMYIPPTNFTFTVRPLTCTGQLWITMNDTTITFATRLRHRRRAQRLYVTVDESSVQWGSLRFNHTINSTMCHVAQSVVEAFVGKIDARAERAIKEQMATLLPSFVAANLSNTLAQLPLPVLRRPRTTPDRLELLIGLVPRQTNAASDESASSSDSGDSSDSSSDSSDSSSAEADMPWPLPARDLAVALPAASLNTFVARQAERGALRCTVPLLPAMSTRILRDVFPVAYALCPVCRLELVVEATDAHAVRIAYNERDDDDSNNSSHGSSSSSSDGATATSPSSVTLTLTNVRMGVIMTPLQTREAVSAGQGDKDDVEHSRVTAAARHTLAVLQHVLPGDMIDAVTSATAAATTTSRATPSRAGASIPLITLDVNATCGVAHVHACDDVHTYDDSDSNGRTPQCVDVTRDNDDGDDSDSGAASQRGRRTNGVSWLQYAVQHVRDVQMRVCVSTMGDVNATHLARQAELLANVFVVPYVNTFSPLPWPVATHVFVNISDTVLTFGLDVNIV